MRGHFLTAGVLSLLLVIVAAPRFAAAQEEVKIGREVTASQEKEAKRIDCQAAPSDQVVGDELTVTITYKNDTDETQTLQVTHDTNPDDPEAYNLLEGSISVTNGSYTSDGDANRVTYDFEVPPNDDGTGEATWEAAHEYLDGGQFNRGRAKVEEIIGEQTETCRISIHLPGSIIVRKYEDLDADGVKGENEPTLSGWTVDLTGTDVRGLEQSGGGSTPISFDPWPPGLYTITEENREGWNSSTGTSTELQLTSGEDIEFFFGNWEPGELHGEKWRDDDGDGEKDQGEPRLSGWTINLTGTTGGGQEVSRQTTTDEQGRYWFMDLPPGDYEISEEVQSGEQTYPGGNGTHAVTLQSGDIIEGLDFGNLLPPGSIHGQKFFDKNGNGQRDEDSNGDGNPDSLEVGLNGFVIELYDSDGDLVDTQTTHSMDLNGDGEIDPWSEMGLFWFEDLPPDTYTVVERGPEEPWTQTVPEEGYTVDLGPGETVDGLLFGNTTDQIDFGDLPDPKKTGPLDPFCMGAGGGIQCYPTLLPGGARHVINGPWLGPTKPDAEPDGQPTPAADGDDSDAGGDDEDGFQGLTFSGGNGQITYRVNAPGGQAAWLSAWIDFNNDGILALGERVCFQKVGPGLGLNVNCMFPIPSAMRGGYVRARISTDSSTVKWPGGLAPDGEVEDRLGLPGVDGGDAPDSTVQETSQFPIGYPTRLLDNGAIHAFGGNTRIGDTQTDVDLGLPTQLADGDDVDNRDDEDGLLLEDGAWIYPWRTRPDVEEEPGCFVTATDRREIGDDKGSVVLMGVGTDVDFRPLATKTGFFSGWIDWNRDGDWQDPGEQIFDGEQVDSGPNYTLLSFQVPTDADLGWTFARFRYSQFEDQMPPTGIVTTGEVEDCLVGVLGRSSSDFGDAPDIYPTLSADGGPWHVAPIEGSLHLGETRDAEVDGQPDPGAQGDDSDADGDDEDGVSLPDPLHPGTTSQMEVVVTATSGRTGFLNAWFDWNQDGDWQDEGEHVVDDEELGAGTHTLPIPVPENREPGPVVARFRFSETEDLGPRRSGGLSNALDTPNGEVEDYIFEVVPEDVSDSGSGGVDEDGPIDFGPPGVIIDFCDVSGQGWVSVYKASNPPGDVSGIDRENVSQWRHLLDKLGSLSFGDCTRLKFLLSELTGIGNPDNVHIIQQTANGQNTTAKQSWTELETTVDDNGTPDDPSDDLLVANIGSLGTFALASDTEPLPVELTRFEAQVENQQVRLRWQTASETNNAGFHVQRRVAGSNQWRELGFVEGAGTTEEAQTYEFVDAELPFTADSLAYRLRQVDVEGTSSLSKKVLVRRGGPESVRLLGPYPNPAGTQTTVRYALPRRQSVRLAVYDALGRRVMTLQNGTAEAGRTELQLDTSQLSPGVYFLRLAAGTTNQTRRLTVVR